MTAENIKNIILQGEGIDIEFKMSSSQLPSNIYDTICAFLNRNGGHIILGVDDKGTILGVDKGSIKDQLNTLVKGLNNPQILNPTTYLSPQVVDIDGKKVVNPDNFRPHPKNPTIANFFRQLGWVEELGYGVRNMFKYCPLYVEGALPIIEEKDIFKLTIRYESEGINSKSEGIKTKELLLKAIQENEGINALQLAETLGENIKTVERNIKELRDEKKIEFAGARKTGGYFLMIHKE